MSGCMFGGGEISRGGENVTHTSARDRFSCISIFHTLLTSNTLVLIYQNGDLLVCITIFPNLYLFFYIWHIFVLNFFTRLHVCTLFLKSTLFILSTTIITPLLELLGCFSTFLFNLYLSGRG